MLRSCSLIDIFLSFQQRHLRFKFPDLIIVIIELGSRKEKKRKKKSFKKLTNYVYSFDFLREYNFNLYTYSCALQIKPRVKNGKRPSIYLPYEPHGSAYRRERKLVVKNPKSTPERAIMSLLTNPISSNLNRPVSTFVQSKRF